ncbi:MAG: DJ-1/PfpI family protein [Candidatus Babeliales bacterium]|nr:DJ-1/PfpI family protein [Candidatus Babeliales bacterium]
MKKILLVIASKGFQPIEYGVTREILEAEDIKVETASNAKDSLGNAISSDNKPAHVDYLLQDVNVDHYDGLFIIGGQDAMEHLDNDNMYRLIHEVDRRFNKIYGAICISTRILANAGVLEDRNVTGWDNDKKLALILKDVGANYVKAGVVVDDNIITATGPDEVQDFGQAILKALYTRQPETAEDAEHKEAIGETDELIKRNFPREDIED